MVIFRVFTALELGLTGLHEGFHNVPLLPLGGGHLQQIALSLIAAFIISEIYELVRAAVKAARARARARARAAQKRDQAEQPSTPADASKNN